MSRRFAVVAPIAAVALWNIAFLVVPTFGIWLSVGAAAAVVLVASNAWGGVAWRELLTPRPRDLLIGFAAMGVLALASELIYPPLATAWPALATEAHVLYALFGHPTPFEAWVALPAIASAEELIFRGALLGAFEARWSKPVAAAVATTVYVVAHLASGSWALVGLAAVCGAGWTALRSATRSLWPALLCHVGWDLVILVVRPLV